VKDRDVWDIDTTAYAGGVLGGMVFGAALVTALPVWGPVLLGASLGIVAARLSVVERRIP
jgi:hypothetical protein